MKGKTFPLYPDDRPGSVKSYSADQGTPLMETQSDETETAKEERMQTDSLLRIRRNKHTIHQNTHQHTYTASLHNKIPSN
jgi:hypothetical protein